MNSVSYRIALGPQQGQKLMVITEVALLDWITIVTNAPINSAKLDLDQTQFDLQHYYSLYP